jgi:two-component system, cell cycle sensor histidine kinase and response regulator CckA
MSSDPDMSPTIDALRTSEPQLLGAINAALLATAFENRFSLHPRRLAEIGQAFCRGFVDHLGTGDEEAAAGLGSRCAHEGLGDDTIPVLLARIQGFLIETLGPDIGLLMAVDRFATPLLRGFMTAREDQILRDQEQLRRALTSALESQGRELAVKNHAINTSINGIMLTSLDMKATWVNASFLALWGYAGLEDVAGRDIEDFWAEPDSLRIRGLVSSAGGWRGELEAKRKDGTTFSVEMAASRIRDEAGAAFGIMASFVDVTERKRLMAQVVQSQKMEALGQLAGGITHDFNNLLTAISGYLQFLLLDAAPDSRMHNDLMQIRAAVDRGTGLTRQLRLFTRQTTGNRQVLSVNDVARETWEILKRTFPPLVTIDLALCPTLWAIEADPNQLSQVLVNLCVNARDAMMDGSTGARGGVLGIVTRNVELAEDRVSRYMTARAGRYVSVSVSDTGSGIAPEIMERLFVPFVTTKSARSGTGLGLAVVYGIVSSHHGFIDVRSAAGTGTVFELLFPMSSASGGSPAAEDPAAPALARGQGRVLVVDDEQQIREIMERVLVSCGYTVLTAGNGADALACHARTPDLDLVILDMMMPGMNGRECLAELRARDPSVRVLVTTGYTSDGSVQQMLMDGALGVVEKPLDLKSFTDMVLKSVSMPRIRG